MADSYFSGAAFTDMIGDDQGLGDWLDMFDESHDSRLQEENVHVQHTSNANEDVDPTASELDHLLPGSDRRDSETSTSHDQAVGAVYGREYHFLLPDLAGRLKKRARGSPNSMAPLPSVMLPPQTSWKPCTFITEDPAALYVLVGTAPSLHGQPSGTLLGTTGQPPHPDRHEKIFAISAKTGKQYIRQKHHNVEFRSAPDAHAPLPDCDGGAVETLTYLPHTTQRPIFGMRLRANGLTDKDVAKIQLYARGLATKKNIKKRHATVRRQMSKNGKHVFDDEGFTSRKYRSKLEATTDYSLSYCTTLPSSRQTQVQPAAPRLIDLIKDVVNEPSAEDSGWLTQAIRYAVENNDTTLTTADVRQLALREHFALPAASMALTSNWDAEGRDRVLASMLEKGMEASGDSEGDGSDGQDDEEDEEEGGDDDVDQDGDEEV
ncbi:hypothetical protein LTR91_001978 [Friedmanniomyces endolithicus]|uniref:Uncharacterized protein n=2 Tax=Friedmanniomyces endolithicus TaxID=329885 RepID=A0AAN6R059_9PEZI|nr:hypothetical protein LTS09_015161 [Friedmanniomyces endolithicus]KAK0363211.1 hypothetical protein LTR94_016120 [Friedmanniomyces endolithicus]KAK0815503.1 hypothetical protein LTR59_000576 [Friedmanniomyces endolithicus]KAK0818291.1 hypothetical protein LTR38_001338 [Friedmanniomyces endolithicus]KAK0819371.1 hypothetical protein LTR75_002140 [Friedmanniomyces endolithicus]